MHNGKRLKSIKHGHCQRKIVRHRCRLEYRGTGPRGERPVTLSSRKKKE